MTVNGSELLVKELVAHDVRDFFHIVGGPMTSTIILAIEQGIRGIDVRDERAGTYAATAYSRVTRRPGVVMACSGPGTINTVTGVAHAFADGAPIVVLGGSASMFQRTTGAFQETDQVGVMRPITKWAHQVTDADGVADAITRGFQIATSGAPGPVYLDLPANALYGESQQPEAVALQPRPQPRGAGDPALIARAADRLRQAERPIVIAGSGVLWSEAWEELRRFVELTGVPFYTTPIAGGLVPEDHALSFPAARSTAFREADCIFVVGTRDNYILNFLQPPVVSAESTVVTLNSNPEDISRNRLADVGILADAKLGLGQLAAELGSECLDFSAWTARLGDKDAASRERSAEQAESSEVPIHPFRLATEVRKAAPREAIMVVDGRETLAFGRRAIPSYMPAGMLNPGTYGTMGVGVPFAIGAKVASGSSPVVALVGDGAFGYHMTEIDTAVRHSLGFVCVIANNAGWTANRDRPGHALAYSDYDKLGDVFGCFGAKVTEPSELAPTLADALAYAERESKPALVNVVMASVRAGGRSFSKHARQGESDYDAV